MQLEFLKEGSTVIEVHGGKIEHKHSFDEVFLFLKKNKMMKLTTVTGKEFIAEAKRTRDGRDAIVFYRSHKESARAYNCCWGSYYNCNRTRFGMYAIPLDGAL